MASLLADQRIVISIAIGILLVGFFVGRQISAVANWRPAGAIALMAAAPLIPNLQLGVHLSADDLLPIVGLGLMIWQAPLPSLTHSRLFRVALVAVLAATVARIASAIANGTDVADSLAMLIEAIGRPAMLVAIAAYVATAQSAERRRHFVTMSLAAVGTFEAAFGFLAFALAPLGGIGVQLSTSKESIGGCPARVTGTLGLSPNHIGAIFVLTLPITIGLAVSQSGWRRWILGAAAGMQAAVLVLTFTRASIILAIAASVLVLLYQRNPRIFVVSLAVSAVLLFSATSLACNGSHNRPIGGSKGGSGVGITDRFRDTSDRPALWYSAAVMMVDNPWFGVGLGRMRDVQAGNPARYIYTPLGNATNSAHNTVLLAGAETGVFGAIATLALNGALALAALIWILRGRHDPVLSSTGFAVGAFLAQGMVNNLFTVGATSVLLALVIGTFASAARKGQDAESSRADPNYAAPRRPPIELH